ncbi:hypothetical protein P7K49_040659 [Saguinus oedipus]|uniref:Uncharacterized protein n=1 Tax=Saguinus oedipus TaxID=9490 RepID=A0ABQ9T933_SAGOE|nr:hypothetical protein P7K49_040659 [Saguinus oedipus]
MSASSWQCEVVSSLKGLHRFVNSSQLTADLDGSFPYSHGDWVCFRQVGSAAAAAGATAPGDFLRLVSVAVRVSGSAKPCVVCPRTPNLGGRGTATERCLQISGICTHGSALTRGQFKHRNSTAAYFGISQTVSLSPPSQLTIEAGTLQRKLQGGHRFPAEFLLLPEHPQNPKNSPGESADVQGSSLHVTGGGGTKV